MMTHFAQVLAATDEVATNGAALVDFYGRHSGVRHGGRSNDRRIRRRERACRS
ncbi:MAG: hypothetical protein ACOY99_12185 [Pseudomonadota bacterium]